jgi:hypothetical protein
MLRNGLRLVRVIPCDHWVVRWKGPAPPVLIGRHIEGIPQMSLEHHRQCRAPWNEAFDEIQVTPVAAMCYVSKELGGATQGVN